VDPTAKHGIKLEKPGERKTKLEEELRIRELQARLSPGRTQGRAREQEIKSLLEVITAKQAKLKRKVRLEAAAEARKIEGNSGFSHACFIHDRFFHSLSFSG
jgi:hypothetical protein